MCQRPFEFILPVPFTGLLLRVPFLIDIVFRVTFVGAELVEKSDEVELSSPRSIILCWLSVGTSRLKALASCIQKLNESGVERPLRQPYRF